LAAVGALVTYGLDISVQGNGTTDPPPGSYAYAEGETVTITAYPEEGYQLDHWEMDGVFAGASSTITVTMDSYHAVVAVFTIQTFYVTVQASTGGTTSPIPGTYGPYNYGDQFIVTAIPEEGYQLVNWLVDGVTYEDNPLTLVVTTEISVFANFQPIPQSTLSGTVFDSETGLPVEGASVTLDATSTTTDANGKYSLTVSAGTYTLTVSKSGYQTWSQTIDMSEGGTYTQDVTITKTPQSVITGTVKNSAGSPIEAALVSVNSYSATTDVEGKFVLTLPPNVYTVTVTKSGYRTVSQTVDASTAGTYTLDFTLTEAQSIITGVISDIETGEPIADAEIAVNSYSTTSGSDGSFSVTVAPAAYTVTVSKEGYQDWSQTVDASTPATYVINVALTKAKEALNYSAVIMLGVIAIGIITWWRSK
jgi:uncharacterized membrane protein